MPEDVREVNLAEEAGLTVEAPESIEGLITFDELVMNFLQQYDYRKHWIICTILVPSLRYH